MPFILLIIVLIVIIYLIGGYPLIEAELGKNVTLNCSVAFPGGKHQPFTVQWRKDNDTKVYQSNDTGHQASHNRVYAIPGTTLLQITKVTWEDYGWYECKVIFYKHGSYNDSRDVQNLSTSKVYLEVTTPKIPTNAVVGKKVDLTCRATGNISYLKPKDVMWTFKGFSVSSTPWLANHVRMTNKIGGSMTIHPVRKNDTGLYACEIRSERLSKFVPIVRYMLNVN